MRKLQDELTIILQQTVQDQFTKIQTCNDQLQAFLQQLGLPMSLQSLTVKKELPNEIWLKIEEFQKKGGDSNFQQSIQANSNVVELNNDMIADMQNTITKEAEDDSKCRV